MLTLVPGAGEAVLWQPMPTATVDDRLRALGDPGPSADPFTGTDEEWEAICEAQAAKNWARANSRAKVRSRRYIVANRLRYMWVLTRLGGQGLHGADGRRQMMAAAAGLARALRTELGSEFPYWYSPELHPEGKSESCPDPAGCGCGGHGWHLNFFLAKPFPIETMKRLWQAVDPGNGYEVRYKDWTKDNRLGGLTFAEKLRAGARYGSKYATKDWSTVALAGGAHRYEVAQKFTPAQHQVVVTDRAEAEAILRELSRSPLVTASWFSGDFDEWDGPVCWGYEWTPPAPPRGSP